MDLFAPHGAIKSTLWPASRKKVLKLHPQDNTLESALQYLRIGNAKKFNIIPCRNFGGMLIKPRSGEMWP